MRKVFLSGFIGFLSLLLAVSGESAALEKYLADFFPGYATSQRKTDPFPHVLVYGQDTLLRGAGFFSKDAVPDTDGFKGPVNIFIGVTVQGDISGVAVDSHRETPSYARRAFSPGFLAQFTGKKVSDPFIVGDDIQAVSGATVSSVALIRVVREAVRDLSPRIFMNAGSLNAGRSAASREKQ